jgi:putative methyltransferase (TIGR04325 family)
MVFSSTIADYGNMDLVEHAQESTELLKNTGHDVLTFSTSQYSIINAISMIEKSFKSINILDFGGAAGAHYFFASKYFGDPYIKKYIIVETKNMTAQSKKRNLWGDKVTFISDLIHIKEESLDLIYSNSGIQYTHDPFQTLTELLKLKSKYLYFSRLGLNNLDNEIVSIVQKTNLSDNGPLYRRVKKSKVSYPVKLMGKEIFENLVSRDYQIKFIVNEGAGYRYKRRPFPMYTYFLRLK